MSCTQQIFSFHNNVRNLLYIVFYHSFIHMYLVWKILSAISPQFLQDKDIIKERSLTKTSLRHVALFICKPDDSGVTSKDGVDGYGVKLTGNVCQHSSFTSHPHPFHGKVQLCPCKKLILLCKNWQLQKRAALSNPTNQGKSTNHGSFS